MASIAKTALTLSTDATGLYSGLTAATARIQSFASNAKSAITGGVGRLSGIAGMLGGPVLGIVAGAITSQIGSLSEKFAELSEKINHTAKTAAALGTSVEVVQGLGLAAKSVGIDAEAAEKGLMHFRKTTSGDFMEALAQFADRVRAVEDPMMRASMAADKFSKGGVKWVPLLAQGGDAVRAFVQKARDLGLALSDVDASKVEQAKGALGRMSSIVEGIYNKLIVAMSPAITFIAEKFESLAPIINRLSAAAGEWIDKYWRVAAMVIETIVTQVVQLWKEFSEGAGISSDFFSQWPTWGELVKKILYGMAVALAYVWDTLKAGAGVAITAFGGMATAVGAIGKALGASWADKVLAVGKAATATGVGMVSSFGKTKQTIDKLFDGLWVDQQAKAKEVGEAMTSAYHPVTAAVQGSREALAIEARFKGENLLNPQLELQRKNLAELQQIRKAIEKEQPKVNIGVL